MSRGYLWRPCPRLFGHRGAAGVAPENTLESFRRALDDGAGYLELDVRATRDGAIVVIHDATVDRTTEGTGPVDALDLGELRRLDAGFRFEVAGRFPWRGRGVGIPALADVLDEFPGTPLNIEIKQGEPRIEETVVSLLRDRRVLDDVVLAAEDDSIMRRIRAAAPEAATSFSAVEVRDFFERCLGGAFAGYRPPGVALQIPPRFGSLELVSAETVAAAHRAGLEMHVWTIDDPDEMRRLLDLGVDGVMSDFPDVLRCVASAVGS